MLPNNDYCLYRTELLVSKVDPVMFLSHFDSRTNNVLNINLHCFHGLIGIITDRQNVHYIIIGYQIVKRKNSDINSSLDLK